MTRKAHEVSIDQGTFLQPVTKLADVKPTEGLADESTRFTLHTGLDQPEELGLAGDLVGHNINLRESLLKLGQIARSAPAANTGRRNPALERSLKAQYDKGSNKVAQNLGDKNQQYQEEFDEAFAKMWGLAAVKASGLLSKEVITREFNEDKQRFRNKFSENPINSVDNAQKNRAAYRRKLSRQERIYRKKNLGWPGPDVKDKKAA